MFINTLNQGRGGALTGNINSLNSIKRTEFLKNLFLLYVHECFASEYVYVSHVYLLSLEAKVLELLELDLEMVVSPVWTRGIEAGPLEEEPLILISEPPLQPLKGIF